MKLDQDQKIRLGMALAAVIAVTFGFTVLNKNNAQTSANAAANSTGQRGGFNGPPGGSSGATGATGGAGAQAQGMAPGGGQGGPPQMTELTGSTATKAAAAAKAKVSGTVDHEFKNPRGTGYIVIIEKSDGTHVAVEMTTSFKVTGTHEMQQGPGGPMGGNSQQGTAPQQGTSRSDQQLGDPSTS